MTSFECAHEIGIGPLRVRTGRADFGAQRLLAGSKRTLAVHVLPLAFQ